MNKEKILEKKERVQMSNEKILESTQILNSGLFFEKSKTLIIGDLQLGYEENLNQQGVMIPRVNLKQIMKKLEEIFSKIGKIEKVIINGDLKHEFGRVSEQEWNEVLDVLRYLKQWSKEVIVVKGNHDVFFAPIGKWENMKVQENYFLENEKILILHGHKIPDKNKEFAQAKILIIGHEHPAVTLREGSTVHKYKCFLKGKWTTKTIVVMPSFSELSGGHDILKQETLSPFLENGLSEFQVWVVEDQTYYFGKIKDLMEK
ncbi:MAG: metallophosphoesterase [Candidatus Diapherotrites archaeon]|nr:metallophosphoesterase [Candidatus Diapherotrites archaeon]